jgi:hypothetical protein
MVRTSGIVTGRKRTDDHFQTVFRKKEQQIFPKSSRFTFYENFGAKIGGRL